VPQQTPDLIPEFLESFPMPSTRRSYATDLRAFARFLNLGQPTKDLAGLYVEFLRQSPRQIRNTWLTYQERLRKQGRAASTINRRLAAIKSLLRFAHGRGLSHSDGSDLNLEAVSPYQDTRGIGKEELERLFGAPGMDTLRGKRDRGVLLLLGQSGLRRGELCALNVADADLKEQTLLVPVRSGKQHPEKERILLSPECAEAIAAYLVEAGHEGEPEVPLFRSLDRNPDKAGRRLTIDGVYFLVRYYGEQIGLPSLSSNQLRRSAINRTLEETGGDKQAARTMSRHADTYPLSVYEKNRRRKV
jgi:integrase/recombinase XerC